MVQLESQPDVLSFSSMLGDIVFSGVVDSGLLVLSLSAAGGVSIEVLRERFSCDADGRVTVCELSSLVEPYARRYGSVVLSCTFTVGSSDYSISPVTVLYCMSDVVEDASVFTSSHFLSLLSGEKLTAYGRDERLYAYGASTVAVSAEVRLPVGTFTTLTATLNAISTVNGISQFDVSPSTIISATDLIGGRLLSYTITAGHREQSFRVVVEQTPPDPSLIFVNSFGCEEFFHCSGTLKRDSKYTRSSVRICGRLRQYKIDEERHFTANTGWLNDAMLYWAEDLFLSDSVYLWEDGHRGKEVVLSESKSELTNEEDELVSFEFTYVYAQRIHHVLRKSRSVRLFSDHFEEIYN